MISFRFTECQRNFFRDPHGAFSCQKGSWLYPRGLVSFFTSYTSRNIYKQALQSVHEILLRELFYIELCLALSQSRLQQTNVADLRSTPYTTLKAVSPFIPTKSSVHSRKALGSVALAKYSAFSVYSFWNFIHLKTWCMLSFVVVRWKLFAKALSVFGFINRDYS